MNIEELTKMAEECGFTHTAPLKMETLKMLPKVREMCAKNTCGAYGKNWSCPPACGELEECQAKVNACRAGILVQTVGELEDEMDGEGMMEAAEQHKEHFAVMYRKLLEAGVPVLALGAGGCTRCKTCTYPDEPCRFPDEIISPMEGYGMLVLEVCKANNLDYYYGPNFIAYTGCFLLR